MPTGRDKNGKFTTGNPGGPGRPRRTIEMDYLATLADSIDLDDWREIVNRAVEDAKAGDRVARVWLGKYVLGSQPSSLTKLAAMEARNEGPEHEIAEEVLQRERWNRVDRLFDSIDNRGKWHLELLRRLLARGCDPDPWTAAERSTLVEITTRLAGDSDNETAVLAAQTLLAMDVANERPGCDDVGE